MLSKLNINIGDMIIIHPGNFLTNGDSVILTLKTSNISIGMIRDITDKINGEDLYFQKNLVHVCVLSIDWVVYPMREIISDNIGKYVPDTLYDSTLSYSFSYLTKLIKDKRIEVVPCQL